MKASTISNKLWWLEQRLLRYTRCRNCANNHNGKCSIWKTKRGSLSVKTDERCVFFKLPYIPFSSTLSMKLWKLESHFRKDACSKCTRRQDYGTCQFWDKFNDPHNPRAPYNCMFFQDIKSLPTEYEQYASIDDQTFVTKDSQKFKYAVVVKNPLKYPEDEPDYENPQWRMSLWTKSHKEAVNEAAENSFRFDQIKIIPVTSKELSK